MDYLTLLHESWDQKNQCSLLQWRHFYTLKICRNTQTVSGITPNRKFFAFNIFPEKIELFQSSIRLLAKKTWSRLYSRHLLWLLLTSNNINKKKWSDLTIEVGMSWFCSWFQPNLLDPSTKLNLINPVQCNTRGFNIRHEDIKPKWIKNKLNKSWLKRQSVYSACP